MNDPVLFIIIFCVGLAAGFADSIVGSGGLISIPALIFLGLSPQAAIATDRLGSVGQTIAALIEFSRAKKVRWGWIPIFTILALLGSIIGSRLLVAVNTLVLQKVVGVLLIVLLPFLFYKRSVGLKPTVPNNVKTIIGYILYFMIMIYNGFFGTGSGPFALYTALYFFGFTIIEANATAVLPWFFLSISSLIVFAQSGIIDYQSGIVLLIGMTLGGWLGARIAVAKGDVWIRRLFITVIILSGMKLLFWP